MKKIRPETFQEYHYLSNPLISPDKRNVAFVVQEMKLEENRYEGRLYKAAFDGGEPVRVLEKDVKRFGWLPDGRLLICEPGKPEWEEKTVYTGIDPDSGAEEEIACLPVRGGIPMILTDGRWVVSGQTEESRPDFSGMSQEACEKAWREQKNPPWREIRELPFWGDGRGFTCGKRNTLFLCDPKSKETLPITPKYFQVMGTDCLGNTVLYTGCEYEGCAEFRKGIYVYRADTGENRCLVEPGIFDVVQAVLLDEDTALFRGARKEDSAYSEGRFYRLDLASGHYEKISDYDKKSEFCCIVGDTMLGMGQPFKADGGRLYFVTVEGEEGYIRSIDRDGNLSERLTKSGVTNFFDVRDERLVFYGYRGDRLGELYERREDGEEKELTHFNDRILREYRIGKRLPISFRDSDGVEIRGWVIPPVDYEPGKKYPAILNIHGGPRGTWGSEFNHEMQLWASSGYFVLFCNPRGSAGRGDAFADLKLGMGNVDFDNFMQFTDECLKAWPDIDEKRLGVAGGSYGGYMVNWMIGHTKRFAAASSQRSISNWVSMDGLSDMGYYANGLQFGGFVEDCAEHLWEISPLKYAGNAETPTIFLQSEGDYRCPMDQALQMYAALKRRGVETKLILFSGESHGLSREGKPQNRLKRMEEILNWMDAHLKS